MKQLKHFFISRRQSITNNLVKQIRLSSPSIDTTNASSSSAITTTSMAASPPRELPNGCFSPLIRNPKFPNPLSSFSNINRSVHTLPVDDSETDLESDEDGPMSEFLSRFTWIMKGNLSEAYPDCDKQTINGMLLVIVDKVVSVLEEGGLGEMLGATENTPTQDFSQDLWKAVWEVSNSVLEDMKRERKKEEMKRFLQCEEVKDMTRFASEVGVRGEMLREMRFKWAKEKMQEFEFYQNLESIRQQDQLAQEEEEAKAKNAGADAVEEAVIVEDGDNVDVEEKKPKVVALPQRKGKIKYKIYGLDLSDAKWAEVADRIHEAEKLITPEEPKPITGKCKLVNEKILSLTTEDDPSSLLSEWVELLQPSRVDWLTLLDKLRERNVGLYLKIAELVLSEESFQTSIRDYSKLIDAHAVDNRIEDAERILKKMTEKGIEPDILTSTILVNMYSKANNLDRAKEAFEGLRSQGFQPDMRTYKSMIMAYVNAGQPKLGESLMRDMEVKDIKPTKDIYMALLRSFSERGEAESADRIFSAMRYAHIQLNLESGTLLVEAYGHAGYPDQARNKFDNMIGLGHRPDDRCTASMIAAYEKKNLLDKALNLLLQLEKDGFEPGIATYTVLVDWLGKLQLVDEAEEMLRKITEKGDTPPLKVHVSLCDMYSRAGNEKKALQALGIVEGKKEVLGADEFERIIHGLIVGGLTQDANKIFQLMKARGFSASEPLKMSLMASQAIRRQRPTAR
ncbi:Pentatricopeptide repeat [Macleaya cordata]|uniref:Pentatricopeptide repeat n=1 Tax=Macleaya cordata TaxID=56857 RepID=A0A200R8Q0_MACCD|nr:Pentatricopeptide repeat [Macleaya cordata]